MAHQSNSMSNARREALPIFALRVKLKNRRVDGGLMADGSILWRFKSLSKERAIESQKIRLSKEALDVMFFITKQLNKWEKMKHEQ
jgi:hypothetical protein